MASATQAVSPSCHSLSPRRGVEEDGGVEDVFARELRAQLNSIEGKLDRLLAAEDVHRIVKALSPRPVSAPKGMFRHGATAGISDEGHSGEMPGIPTLDLHAVGAKVEAWAPPIRSTTIDTAGTPTYSSDAAHAGERKSMTSVTSKKERVKVLHLDEVDTSTILRRAKTRLTKTLKDRTYKKLDQLQATGLWRAVNGTRFQLLMSAVRCCHCVTIGFGAEHTLAEFAYNQPRNVWPDYAEAFFTVVFLLELVLRIIAEQWCFFLGPEWKWNMFDSILVVLSIVDLAYSSSGANDGNKLSGFGALRILRLTRFVRLMRGFRVARQLGSLRMIIVAIGDSMQNLLWCFIFIAFFMYIFAVLFVYAAAEYFADARAVPDVFDKTGDDLQVCWGGIYRSMITLFAAITGGLDWQNCVVPLTQVHDLYEDIFIFYIFFMLFGVLNVVVGAFVATSQQIAEGDRDLLVKHERQRLKKYTDKLKTFFKEADMDNSGTLSWGEFSAHLREPSVSAYFQALELDVSQAHVLFELLDRDASDQVTVDEFLEGCVRLKGGARSIDMNMLQFMVERIFVEVQQLQLASLPAKS